MRAFFCLKMAFFLLEEERFLLPLAIRVALHEHRLHGPRIDTGPEHHRRGGHRSRGEILYLVHVKSLQSRVPGQVLHVAHRAAGMGGNEIRNQTGPPPVFRADPVELDAQPFEQFEGRLGDIVQDIVLRMLRRHFQPAGRVVEDEFLEIRPGGFVHESVLREEKIVADAAADVDMPNPLYGADLQVQVKHLPVGAVQIRTGGGIETGLAAAFVAERRIFAAHPVHVGRGRAEIGNIPGKFRHGSQFPGLPHNGRAGTGLDELALVGGDRAEVAAPETATVRDDRVLDHVVRRNPLALVARMRQFREGQVPEGIHFLRRGGREGRIDLNIPVADRFDDRGGVQHIGLGLDQAEVLGEGLLALPAHLEGMERQSVRNLAPPRHPEGNLRERLDIAQIAARFDGAGQFQHRLLPHPVAEVVRGAPVQNGGQEFVLPVVVVGQPTQGGFDAADHDRDVGIELLEDLRVDAHRIVRSLAGFSARGVSIVVPEPLPRRVVVHHGVHRPGIHAEVQPRRPELAEIAQVVPPVGLRNHRHPITETLQPTSNAGGSEGRMIHERVSRKQDHVDVVPTQGLNLLHGSREHVAAVWFLFHGFARKAAARHSFTKVAFLRNMPTSGRLESLLFPLRAPDLIRAAGRPCLPWRVTIRC